MVRKEEVGKVTHTIQSLLKELGELKAAKEKTTREYMQVLAENIAKDDEIERLKDIVDGMKKRGEAMR
jgi:tRNA C32,U32 (ribose-2'-O)-methylase TrmJ